MLENLVKTSYNACVTLREADREELRMVQLDPLGFPLGFRNGDSFGKRGAHSPRLPAGQTEPSKFCGATGISSASLVPTNSVTEL